MYQKMIRAGNFSVDYLNPSRMGKPESIAIYISGNTEAGSPICKDAKRKLLGMLMLLMRDSESQNLVAVYIDISGAGQVNLSAYRQMLQDKENSIFSKIILVDQDNPGFDTLQKDLSLSNVNSRTDAASFAN
jgi:hypothetical protein